MVLVDEMKVTWIGRVELLRKSFWLTQTAATCWLTDCVFVYLCICVLHICAFELLKKIFWVETNRRHLLVDKPQPPTAKNVQTLEIQKISAPLSINSVWKIEHIESQKVFLGQICLCSVSLGHFYHILNPASIPLGVKRTDTPGLLTDVKFVTSITCSTCVKLSPEI